MGEIVRRVLDGYVTLIEWSPSDPATVEAAEMIFRREVEGGYMAVVEDDGVSTAYEKGAFATIPVHWHEGTRTLTIDKRVGAFPGMLTRRTFQVVLVRPGKPVPFSFTPKPDKTIVYAGDATTVKL